MLNFDYFCSQLVLVRVFQFGSGQYLPEVTQDLCTVGLQETHMNKSHALTP